MVYNESVHDLPVHESGLENKLGSEWNDFDHFCKRSTIFPVMVIFIKLCISLWGYSLVH